MLFSPLVWDEARKLRSDAIRDGRLEVMAELYLPFVPLDYNPQFGAVEVSVRRYGKKEILGFVDDVALNEGGHATKRGENWPNR